MQSGKGFHEIFAEKWWFSSTNLSVGGNQSFEWDVILDDWCQKLQDLMFVIRHRYGIQPKPNLNGSITSNTRISVAPYFSQDTGGRVL